MQRTDRCSAQNTAKPRAASSACGDKIAGPWIFCGPRDASRSGFRIFPGSCPTSRPLPISQTGRGGRSIHPDHRIPHEFSIWPFEQNRTTCLCTMKGASTRLAGRRSLLFTPLPGRLMGMARQSAGRRRDGTSRKLRPVFRHCSSDNCACWTSTPREGKATFPAAVERRTGTRKQDQSPADKQTAFQFGLASLSSTTALRLASTGSRPGKSEAFQIVSCRIRIAANLLKSSTTWNRNHRIAGDASPFSFVTFDASGPAIGLARDRPWGPE